MSSITLNNVSLTISLPSTKKTKSTGPILAARGWRDFVAFCDWGCGFNSDEGFVSVKSRRQKCENYLNKSKKDQLFMNKDDVDW